METVVLYPSPGIGHLVSMVEFGKLIHTHHPSLSLVILIFPTPTSDVTNKYINTTASDSNSNPNPNPITFHHLPADVVPPDFSSDFMERAFGIPELYNPLLHQTLLSLSHKSTIKAVILDFFTDAAFQVSSTSLHLPTYYFFTGGASLLSVFLNIPTLHSTKDSNDYFDVPGLPPIHASDMPTVMLEEQNSSFKKFVNASINIANSSGVVLNTFTGFEQRAADTLQLARGGTGTGKCIPPLYLVGPIIALPDAIATQNECMKWLDSQPSKSVVFLCFGSMGVLGKKQLMEIAIGLERSEQRFLWVVRDPPPEGSDPEQLPEGFLARTREKGLVVRNWAPQQAILSHGSVGGFVSHCGWNSILESVVAGVPIVAWPLYAEQKLNRLYLVKELKVAVAVKMSADGFVTSEAVEEKVRELMVGDQEGKVVRERVLKMSDKAKAAVGEGGSSLLDLFKLAQPWTAK